MSFSFIYIYIINTTVNLIQQWKKECQTAEERTKARFKQKEKWFKENWNFECKSRIDEENKTNLHNVMIWNQVQENLTKSREIFLSCANKKVKKKLIETLDLRQKDSM